MRKGSLIILDTARRYNTSPGAMRGRNRKDIRATEARIEAIKQLRIAGFSLTRIGWMLGNRDPSTISYYTNDERRRRTIERIKVYVKKWRETRSAHAGSL